MIDQTSQSRAANRSISDLVPGLSELWSVTTGDPDIRIAVLDGLPDMTHPCFADTTFGVDPTARILGPKQSSAPLASAHATHIASIVFAGQKSDTPGIAPHCTGLFIPVFQDVNETVVCSQIDIARGIYLALESGAHVINISGGERGASSAADLILLNALAECKRRGVLVIAAAGNGGTATTDLPAALAGVLAAGSLDEQGNLAEFSNWSDGSASYGLLVPGADIPGAAAGGGRLIQNGTSFSSAILTGVAALLLSHRYSLTGLIDAAAVTRALLETSTKPHFPAGDVTSRMTTGALNLPLAYRLLMRGDDMNGLEEARVSASCSPKPLPEEQSPSASRSMGATASCAGGGGSCGGNGPKQLVYAIGALGFDFGTESRRDYLLQQILGIEATKDGATIQVPALVKHFKENSWDAASVLWTLNLEGTPAYAIQPVGPFAPAGYDFLANALLARATGDAERISVPGVIAGSVSLISGQVVPLVAADVRGIYSWSTKELVKSLGSKKGKEGDTVGKPSPLANFLDRIYFELRNLGLSPEHRAINFAGTNAFIAKGIIADAAANGLDLDSIDAVKSPVCGPGRDCWDVVLTFFDPVKQLERAMQEYRFTVDVSDTVPVMLAQPRSWARSLRLR